MWVVLVVPPQLGFWIIAGDLAGVPVSSRDTLILAAMLSVGVATLIQVTVGHRMPIYEGPAGTYLAALAIVALATNAPSPAAVAGGLIAAGALAVALVIVRADRLLGRVFTPVVAMTFLTVIVITVAPVTFEVSIERDAVNTLGTSVAWISTAIVLVVALVTHSSAAWRPWSIVLALGAGAAAYLLIAGAPPLDLSSGVKVPSLFPWGAPTFELAVIGPFLIAGVLSSLNTIASINVMDPIVGGKRPRSERNGLLAHGVSQAVGACLGNVLGNVARLESTAAVNTVDDTRVRPLAIAALIVIGLSFVGPVVGVLAYIPEAVSAALILFLFGVLLMYARKQVAGFTKHRQVIFVVAVLPAFAWLALPDSLPSDIQLVANPLLVCVVLAALLDSSLTKNAGAGRAGV